MFTHQIAVLFFAAAMLAPLQTLSGQQTLTVDAGGGAMFTDIGAAVAAANSGDLLLVAAGTYAPFTINGKSLTILANRSVVFVPGSTPNPVAPSITIENLTQGQRVHVVGLSTMGFSPAPALALIRNNQGSVWLHDMFFDAFGSPALGIESCADVVIENCLLQGNRGNLLPSGVTLPVPGLRVVASTVRMYDSDARGSTGSVSGAAFPARTAGADGGNGIEVISSAVTIEGGRVHAGSGVTLFATACNQGGSGGDAILMTANSARAPFVRLRNVDLRAGLASTNTCPGTVTNGMQINVQAGVSILDAGVERLLSHLVGVVGPTTVPVQVTGAAGDVAFVFASFPGPGVTISGLPVYLQPPAITLGSVTTGATGRGTLNLPVPGLGQASPPLKLALQALVLDSGTGVYTTNPRPLVLR